MSEHEWCELVVILPDFFGVGAVVFLVFSVFDRVQGLFVFQSGPALQYDFILVLCWFCESIGPELVSKSGTVDPETSRNSLSPSWMCASRDLLLRFPFEVAGSSWFHTGVPENFLEIPGRYRCHRPKRGN